MKDLRHIVETFIRYERDAGVIGVALGTKTPGDPSASRAVAFMVNAKLPRKGAKKTLSNGCSLLPKKAQLGKQLVLTDVIEARPRRRAPKPRAGAVIPQAGAQFTAGCQISNRTSSGTMGALVFRAGDGSKVYALTNRHVAIGTGNLLFIPVPLAGAVTALVQSDLDLVDDDQFLPFLAAPNAYVDVDAALATIPAPLVGRFAADLPGLGRPTGIIQPDYSSVDAYRDSVVGTAVSSYSWNTGRKDGVISHVLYATRGRRAGVIALYTFLIQGANGIVPGESRDSGKIWVMPNGAVGEVDIVALHQGVVRPRAADSQFAVATDFFALSRLLKIAPA